MWGFFVLQSPEYVLLSLRHASGMQPERGSVLPAVPRPAAPTFPGPGPPLLCLGAGRRVLLS